jgi:hypothetical protein
MPDRVLLSTVSSNMSRWRSSCATNFSDSALGLRLISLLVRFSIGTFLWSMMDLSEIVFRA